MILWIDVLTFEITDMFLYLVLIKYVYPRWYVERLIVLSNVYNRNKLKKSNKKAKILYNIIGNILNKYIIY